MVPLEKRLITFFLFTVFFFPNKNEADFIGTGGMWKSQCIYCCKGALNPKASSMWENSATEQQSVIMSIEGDL